VHFMRSGEFVEVRSEVTGLPPGKHGYHVHMFGDCSDPKANSAGDHLDFAALGGAGRTGSYQQQGTGMGDADRNMGPGTTGTASPTPGRSPTGPGGAGTTTGTTGTGTDVGASGTASTGATGGTTTTGPGTTGTGMDQGTAPSTGGAGTIAGQDHTRSRITGNLGDIEAVKGKAATANARIMLPADHIGMLTGRSVQIHVGPNDESKAPDGGAGDPIACGVIGVANEAMELPTPARVESTPGQPSTPSDQPKDQQPGDESDEQKPDDTEAPQYPTPAPR
jgi:Cu/Zn superoxide dismutase